MQIAEVDLPKIHLDGNLKYLATAMFIIFTHLGGCAGNSYGVTVLFLCWQLLADYIYTLLNAPLC